MVHYISTLKAHKHFDLLSKPYSRLELATKVRKVIQGAQRHSVNE